MSGHCLAMVPIWRSVLKSRTGRSQLMFCLHKTRVSTFLSTSLDAGTGCWNRPMSAFLTSTLCSLIARSAGQRLTSGRYNRIIQKRIEGLTCSLPGPFADVCKSNWIHFSCLGGREGGCALQELVLRTQRNNHYRYVRLILFYFGVADSVKANQPEGQSTSTRGL
jgi:hypothetical protein